MGGVSIIFDAYLDEEVKESFFFLWSTAFVSLLILLTITFILLDSTNLLTPLRSGISFLFEPVSVDASEIGMEIKEYAKTITHVSEFKRV